MHKIFLFLLAVGEEYTLGVLSLIALSYVGTLGSSIILKNCMQVKLNRSFDRAGLKLVHNMLSYA